MNDLRVPFIILLVFTIFYFVSGPPRPAKGACLMSYCKSETVTPTRSLITNTYRQVVGDLYDPGHGQRIQIRDTHRRIVGYIERNGRITNTHRQTIGETNGR